MLTNSLFLFLSGLSTNCGRLAKNTDGPISCCESAWRHENLAQVCQLVWQEWETGERCQALPSTADSSSTADWLCNAAPTLSISKYFNCPSGMGSCLRRRLVRNCWNTKTGSSVEFMLVAKVISVGLVQYQGVSEPNFCCMLHWWLLIITLSAKALCQI